MIESQSPQLLRHIGYRQDSNDLAGTQSLSLLAYITDDHLVSPVKEYACRHCGNPVYQREALYEIFFQEVSCDPCVKKYDRDERMREAKDCWNRNCPAMYRETDMQHEEWNKNAWKRIQSFDYDTNIILMGGTGYCKTRIACMRAKYALINGKSVKIMFPDDLKDIPRFVTRREHLVNLSQWDLVVMDDLFLTSASKESVADFLKDLIDRRLRENKTTLITSQVDSEDFEADSQKFKNMSASEFKRIEAIVRRVKEKFVSIDCEALMNDRPEEFEF